MVDREAGSRDNDRVVLKDTRDCLLCLFIGSDGIPDLLVNEPRLDVPAIFRRIADEVEERLRSQAKEH